MKRIGHKGADSIEPGNTTESFDAALKCGVDLIEFDVLCWDGELVIAHDPHDAQVRDTLTLAEALDHLGRPEFANVGLDVDMKHPGFEDELVAALDARGLANRTLVTTMHYLSLAHVRRLSSEVTCGLTIPLVHRDWTKAAKPVQLLVSLMILGHRRYQPWRVARHLRAGEIDAVMAFHALVTPRLVRKVHEAGGELYCWTIDDAKTITRMAKLGVDG
ncbi:MAG: glycerophosphodiester phosphodiesterase, partial [Thermoleophilaceae bacterium]|nr:glycerophosphodiester phosphodiesterase [Thermoleophilaceae bacterium]